MDLSLCHCLLYVFAIAQSTTHSQEFTHEARSVKNTNANQETQREFRGTSDHIHGMFSSVVWKSQIENVWPSNKDREVLKVNAPHESDSPSEWACAEKLVWAAFLWHHHMLQSLTLEVEASNTLELQNCSNVESQRNVGFTNSVSIFWLTVLMFLRWSGFTRNKSVIISVTLVVQGFSWPTYYFSHFILMVTLYCTGTNVRGTKCFLCEEDVFCGGMPKYQQNLHNAWDCSHLCLNLLSLGWDWTKR